MAVPRRKRSKRSGAVRCGVRGHRGAAGPRAQRRWSSACSARSGASTAATSTRGRCSRMFATESPRLLDRPRASENAGRRRHRRRSGHRDEDRVPQPPVGHRAVRGGGHRASAASVRDIFAMGARPIALLNSLRFGPLGRSRRNRYLMEGVVAGISGYGNCIGIPNVGGEIVFFSDRYSDNPLVNAMCVGIVAHARTSSAATAGAPGNHADARGRRHWVGTASTARPGWRPAPSTRTGTICGPPVQVGNPFMEKIADRGVSRGRPDGGGSRRPGPGRSGRLSSAQSVEAA